MGRIALSNTESAPVIGGDTGAQGLISRFRHLFLSWRQPFCHLGQWLSIKAQMSKAKWAEPLWAQSTQCNTFRMMDQRGIFRYGVFPSIQ